jgi:ribosomal protein S18 acetylase RimI-like enzyme
MFSLYLVGPQIQKDPANLHRGAPQNLIPDRTAHSGRVARQSGLIFDDASCLGSSKYINRSSSYYLGMAVSGSAIRVTQPGREAALSYLRRDPVWAAYPLGYLDDDSGVAVDLWASEREGATTSLLALAHLPRLVSFFAVGDPEGISAVMAEVPSPPASGVFSAQLDTMRGLERHINVTTAYHMSRMRLDPRRFQPVAGTEVQRLGLDHLEDVKRLYGMWTDQNQLPSQLSTGVYFGVFANGELVSVAGTHCVSRQHRVAAIGNVLTHSGHRNRGLAKTTTSAVAGELLAMGIERVVLNVRHGNDAAWATYKGLGFDDHCEFLEGVFPSRPVR